MDQYEQPAFHFWEKHTLKASCLILRLTEGSFTFRELNEKILLYSNISKTECCVIISNHHLILSFPHLSFNSSRGEETAVPLIYSPTHLKSSVVDHKGKKDKYNSFQTSWRIGSKLQRKSGGKKKKIAMPPAQIKMETGGDSPSGLVFFSRSTKKVEKKDLLWNFKPYRIVPRHRGFRQSACIS